MQLIWNIIFLLIFDWIYHLFYTSFVPGLSSWTACRTGQTAPRAGTPGFRAPEVLMKYPDQTTGKKD